MSTLRVIQCIASLYEAAAGTTVYLDRLTNLVADVGIDPVILTTGIPAPEIAARYFPVDRPALPFLSALRPSRALREALATEALSAELIHSHGLWLLPNVYPGAAAREAHIPLVVSPHGMLGRGALRFSTGKKKLVWSLLQRRGVAGAACWHATSDKEAADIRTFGINAPIAIVPIGIDLPSAIAPSAQHERRCEILFLGRLHPKKGLDSLLRVWPRVAARHPAWTLRIVGPHDAMGEQYRARATAAALPAIAFEDAAYGDAKWARYRDAALFVLPTQDENFGITVAEALASATPVICSDGAPWAGLREHAAGWWIAQTDEALEAALHSAIALPETERRAMGARGRAWMARDFAWDAIVARMAALYTWLARGGTCPDFVHD